MEVKQTPLADILPYAANARTHSVICAMCGTTDGLQVHHIVPFRLTRDNTQSNLVPLCLKHHKHVETVTHDIEAVTEDFEVMKLFMGNIIREHQDRWRLAHG